MDRYFTWLSSRIAAAVGQPVAFILALSVVLVWGTTGPLFGFSDTWQLVINTGTTIITFLMVFLIQNSQNRDAAAMQAKLDELLRAVDKARGAFIGIEHLTDLEIEQIRAALESEAGSDPSAAAEADRKTAHETLEKLLDRR
ncbi:MAG: low affinity iron permease family protein [Allosphingosinicella sp.]